MKYSLIAACLAFFLGALTPVQALSIHWDDSSGNTDGWSASTSSNTDSGEIGDFDSNDNVILITDPETQTLDNEHGYYNNGLALSDGPGYLTYSFGSLSGFANGSLSIVFKDTADSISELQKSSWNYPATYLFLEGELNGQRILLAYEVGAQPTPASGDYTTLTISLASSNFFVVDEFYHTQSREDYAKFKTLDRLKPVVTLGSTLSDEEFAAFLASCSSLSFRAYHSLDSNTANPILGLTYPQAYTYIKSLDITAMTPIPESSASCLGLLGIAGLLVHRRRVR